MREIVLDTETTGLDPKSGHRLVEIACVEVVNCVATGRTLHKYVNPNRDMPEEAFRVHGLSAEFLANYPPFPEVVGEFLEFIGDARLVIHNADFDMRFINAELTWAGFKPLPPDRSFCTMIFARKRFPGAQASLDALCRRFDIDNSHRTKHGALLDAELLADVYLELMGGRQTGLDLADSKGAAAKVKIDRPFRTPRTHAALPEELTAHEAFVKSLKTPIWLSE